MNKVIIDMSKLQHNIDIIKSRLNEAVDSKGKVPTFIAVLKANAYGMGSLLVAKKLIDNNVNFFAVSEISEGIKLRENGFDNKILLLESTAIESEVEDIIKYDLIATLGSKSAIYKLNELAKRENKIIEAHIKIDTGFGRFGFMAETGVGIEIINYLKDTQNIKVTGMYSHFLESYANDSKTTKMQFDKFINVVNEMKKENFNTGILHICNTPAFFKYPEMYLDAVRVGSGLTGNVQIKETTGLKKVGYLQSTICDIKELPKGYTISYSGTEKLKRDTKIAIITAGYADGIGVMGKKDSITFMDKLRLLKKSVKYNKRIFVEINGENYPVLGRIGMKNTIIDVTGSTVKISDEVNINTNLVFVNSNIIRQEL